MDETLKNALAVVGVIAAPSTIWTAVDRYRNWANAAKQRRWITLAAAVFAAVVMLLQSAALLSWIKLPTPKIEEISNRVFTNQVVRLDNRRFYNCTFENVTLEWSGGRVEIVGLTTRGTFRIHSEVPEIARTMALMSYFQKGDPLRAPIFTETPPGLSKP